MARLLTIIFGVVLTTGIIAGPATAGTVQALTDGSHPTLTLSTTQPNNASEIQPGERLSGVVGVTAAEVEGEMETRTYGVKIARAASNDSKADIVATQVDDLEARLNELEAKKSRLQAARENGSISEGRYQAEIAQLAAETETVKQLTHQIDRTSQQLPPGVLQEKGINVDSIQTLKTSAATLTGPEIAAIAQNIAGPTAGRNNAADNAPGPVSGPPDDTGPANETHSDGNKNSEQSVRGQGDPPPSDDETTVTPNNGDTTETPRGDDEGDTSGELGQHGPRET